MRKTVNMHNVKVYLRYLKKQELFSYLRLISSRSFLW